MKNSRNLSLIFLILSFLNSELIFAGSIWRKLAPWTNKLTFIKSQLICDYSKYTPECNKKSERVSGRGAWNLEDVQRAERRDGCLLLLDLPTKESSGAIRDLCVEKIGDSLKYRTQSITNNDFLTSEGSPSSKILVHTQLALKLASNVSYRLLDLEFIDKNHPNYEDKNLVDERGVKIPNPNFSAYKPRKLCAVLRNTKKYSEFHILGCIIPKLKPDLPEYFDYKYSSSSFLFIYPICPKGQDNLNKSPFCFKDYEDIEFDKSKNSDCSEGTSYLCSKIRVIYQKIVPLCSVDKSDFCLEIKKGFKELDYIKYCGSSDDKTCIDPNKEGAKIKKLRSDLGLQCKNTDKFLPVYSNFRYENQGDSVLYGIDVGCFIDEKIIPKKDDSLKLSFSFVNEEPLNLVLQSKDESIDVYTDDKNYLSSVNRDLEDINYELEPNASGLIFKIKSRKGQALFQIDKKDMNLSLVDNKIQILSKNLDLSEKVYKLGDYDYFFLITDRKNMSNALPGSNISDYDTCSNGYFRSKNLGLICGDYKNSITLNSNIRNEEDIKKLITSKDIFDSYKKIMNLENIYYGGVEYFLGNYMRGGNYLCLNTTNSNMEDYIFTECESDYCENSINKKLKNPETLFASISKFQLEDLNNTANKMLKIQSNLEFEIADLSTNSFKKIKIMKDETKPELELKFFYLSQGEDKELKLRRKNLMDYGLCLLNEIKTPLEYKECPAEKQYGVEWGKTKFGEFANGECKTGTKKMKIPQRRCGVSLSGNSKSLDDFTLKLEPIESNTYCSDEAS